ALLDEETQLLPLGEQIAHLYQSRSEGIALTIRSDEGREYRLELLRSDPMAKGANMGYIDGAGRHPATITEGLHYQGAVGGHRKSLAAMSVFASGEVMLLFANDEGNFVLGKLADGSGKYIL